MDINPGLSGVEEGKEWLVLVFFLMQMKVTNGDGIREVDSRYSVPVKNYFVLTDK